MMTVCCSVLHCVAVQCVECLAYCGRRGDDGSVLQCSAVFCSAVC